MYGVWCVVSGGVTGRREAWLKGKEGRAALFDDETAAQAEAARLTKQMNGPYARADFKYRAAAYSAFRT
jgi:hypothetical protein